MDRNSEHLIFIPTSASNELCDSKYQLSYSSPQILVLNGKIKVTRGSVFFSLAFASILHATNIIWKEVKAYLPSISSFFFFLHANQDTPYTFKSHSFLYIESYIRIWLHMLIETAYFLSIAPSCGYLLIL